MNRREVLKGALAAAVTAWAAPRVLIAQQRAAVQRVAKKLAVIDCGSSNVVAFDAGSELVLVDSGAPAAADQLTAALREFSSTSPVKTVINTHYHAEQTGNNERFAAAGAKIIAHDQTLQWLSNDTWRPEADRYEKARKKEAWPTQTFLDKFSLTAGAEKIECGYLLLAHTNSDIYVHLKDANVIAVGGAASPVQDPELDYFTGAWIGGRVDAMDALLALGNDQTKFVPSFGPVMTKAELKAERDMMEEVRSRLWVRVREGLGPEDMVNLGVLKGLPRTWKDPKKFLYDAAKGMWGHHNKLDGNVV